MRRRSSATSAIGLNGRGESRICVTRATGSRRSLSGSRRPLSRRPTMLRSSSIWICGAKHACKRGISASAPSSRRSNAHRPRRSAPTTTWSGSPPPRRRTYRTFLANSEHWRTLFAGFRRTFALLPEQKSFFSLPMACWHVMKWDKECRHGRKPQINAELRGLFEHALF
jgi:hypothetical protein